MFFSFLFLFLFFMLNLEYLFIGITLFIAFIITLIIFGLSYFLNIQDDNFQKKSSYECGFLPFEDSRGAFNIEFYLVGILFVVFDLEIVFLFPLCLCLNVISFFGLVWSILFIIILTIGFIYEWLKGGLDW